MTRACADCAGDETIPCAACDGTGKRGCRSCVEDCDHAETECGDCDGGGALACPECGPLCIGCVTGGWCRGGDCASNAVPYDARAE